MRVLVIGAGASGAATVVQLAPHGVDVTVVDRGACAWRGPAYLSPADHHRLNIPRSQMSIRPSVPTDFEAFLQEEVIAGRADAKWLAHDHTHVKRGLFGRYVAHRAVAALSAARGRVRLMHGTVTSLDPVAGVARVTPPTDAAAPTGDPHHPPNPVAVERPAAPVNVPFDACVVCIGNLPPSPWPALRPVLSSTRFVGNPWRFPALPPDADVGIIGARLSAVDFALHLHSRGHRGRIVFFSRTGQLAKENPGHDPVPPHPNPSFLEGAGDRLSLDEVANRLRQAGRDAAVKDGTTWHSVVDALRPYTDRLWGRLTDAERRRFVGTPLRDEFEIRRHRIAYGQLSVVEDMLRSGQARHVIGSIVAVRRGQRAPREGAPPTPGDGDCLDVVSAPGFRHHTEERQQPASSQKTATSTAKATTTTTRVDYLVNCTGPDQDFRRTDDPLVRSLREMGAILPEPHGIALLVDPSSGRVLNAAGRPWPHVFAVGPPRKGSEWESIAVADIRRQAAQVAGRIVAAATTTTPAAQAATPKAKL